MANLSFWEQQSFVEYDYIIIGAGLVGLSTALSLREKQAASKILVLERGLLPSGASTRNAGFACFGSLTELYQDLQQLGTEPTTHLVMERWLGLQQLRKRLGDKNIDFINHGGYELIREKETPQLAHLEQVNQLLEPIFERKIFSLHTDLVTEFGFDHSQVKTIIRNPLEGQIDTGKMMERLLFLARQCNIEIITGAEVVQWEESDTWVTLEVKGPREPLQLKAKRLAVCTNAFTKTLFPEIDLQPGRGLVLVTKPLPTLKFKGVFHYDFGYYYFRNFEDRVIFGGGRNQDFESETTDQFGINTLLLDHLINELRTLILPEQHFEVDHSWSGIMAFGTSKQPILKDYSSRIAIGVRLGGMGIAMGSRLGERLADLLCSNT